MDLAVLIVGIMGVIIAAIALPKEKWEWIPKIGKDIGYWLKTRECFYPTKIYFAESKQSNKRAYVYVGKSRKFLRDISWKLAKWFQAAQIRLRRTEPTSHKSINPDELGVIQVLAVYCSQNRKWERVPRPYHESVSFVASESGTTLEQIRRIYDSDTQELQWQTYHDWHKPVICLLRDSSSLCRTMKVKLKDLKKEYELSFIPPSRYSLRSSEVSWKWEQRES